MSNLSASIRQKLLNASKEQQRPFMEILQRFGMERFLRRLSRSAHAEKFVLKGAMLLKTWSFPSLFRPSQNSCR